MDAFVVHDPAAYAASNAAGVGLLCIETGVTELLIA